VGAISLSKEKVEGEESITIQINRKDFGELVSESLTTFPRTENSTP